MKDTITKLLLPLCAAAAALVAGKLVDGGFITVDQVSETSTQIRVALESVGAAVAGVVAIVLAIVWKKFFGDPKPGSNVEANVPGPSGGSCRAS